jgi:3-hydroxymyristoyl/3-hydroxydecanoyl-(acyl carrier protein) dehydratase
MTSETRRVRLGSAAVQRLLPHRRPMLFVDFVCGYDRAPQPTLRAGRHVCANDEILEGHFPSFAIWPGVFTVEGLNQACNLLATISTLQKRWEEAGRDPAALLDALWHLDQVSEMKVPVRPDVMEPLANMLRGAGAMVGFSAGIDVRFTAPVFPGCRLDYLVVETGAYEAAMKYDVEALVDGSPVAKGRLTLSRAREVPSFDALVQGA